MNTNHSNPYVGPRTFRRDEGHLFHGRDREARDLLALVVSEQLVLFYAQSGAGKSSLINTRLIPSLEGKNFEVLRVGRVSGEDQAGIEVANIYVFNLLRSLMQQDVGVDVLARLPLDQFLAGLKRNERGYFYDHAPVNNANIPKQRRALIIDQFEEIFTTHPEAWEKREDLFAQVAQAMENDPYLWVVLVMREDYIAYLDPYAHLLPNGLRVRYYMQRLSREAAIKAMKNPVEKIRPYSEGVAEELVENLASIKVQKSGGSQDVQPGQFVEPVQLQVVCYSLWEHLSPGGTEITKQDLLEVGDVDQSLERYYDERVRTVAEQKNVSERLIREWFEQELITPSGTRNIVLQNRNSDGLSDAVIQTLLGDLVRAEVRAGQVWYELSHDRLIEPVRSSNAKWFNKNLSLFERQAGLWIQQGRPEGMLLRGKELEQAENEAESKTLTRDENDFLSACLRARERDKREKRANRLVQILAITASMAFVAAIFLAIRATSQASAVRSAGEAVRVAATDVANSLSAAQVANVTAEAANRIIEADKLAGQAQIALSQPDSVRLGQLLAILAYRRSADSDKFLPNVYQALFDSVTKGNDLPLGTTIQTAAFSPEAPVKWLIADDALWNLGVRQKTELPIFGGDLLQAAFQSPEKITLLVRDSNYYEPTYIVYVSDTTTQSQNEFSLATPDFEINDIYLSNNGRWLVAYGSNLVDGLSDSRGVQLWKVESLVDGPRSFIVEDGQEVRGVAIRDDGTSLAVAVDKYLYLWSGDKEDILSGTKDTLNPDFKLDTPPSVSGSRFMGSSGRNLQYSADGKWLALLTEDSINLYDLREGPKQADAIPLDPAALLLGFRFSPDNQSLIYITSTYSTCRLQLRTACQPSASILRWPLGGPKPTPSEIYKSTTADITAMDISLDKLVIGDAAGYVRTWTSSQDASQPPLITSAHAGEIDHILIAPDNLTVISSSKVDGARLWELSDRGIEEAVIIHRISNTVSSLLVWSKDRNVLAIGGANGENTLGSNIRVYSGVQMPDTLTDIPFNSNNDNQSELGAIAVSDNWIAAARTDNFRGDELFLVDFWKRNSEGAGITMKLSAEASSLVFYPDGAYLLVAANTGPENQAEIWINATSYLGSIVESVLRTASTTPAVAMPEGGKLTTELRNIQSLQFTRSGQYLIGAGADGALVWNMHKELLHNDTQLANALYPVILSPDEQWLITAALDNTVQLFDFEDVTATAEDVAATPVVIFPVGRAEIDQFAFDQAGSLLAISDKTGKISIYEFPVTSNAAAPVYTLLGPTSEISWLEFSPTESKTGDWFVASSERAVYLWDLANPNERPITLQGYNGNVMYAGFTDDSQWIVTVAQDRTLKFWSLNLESVSRTVCQFADRNLNRAEWRSYTQLPYNQENADICGYGLED